MKENLEKSKVLFIFILISVFLVWRGGELPGLYLDSVNPDYMAVHVLNPSTFSSSWALPYIGIPLLGQVYHGTVTMFFSILSILITGSTSILQLRIVNCIYGTIACFLIYIVLKKIGVKQWIAFGITMVLLVSPNLTSMYKTQYYIELPGVVFMLIATLCFLNWNEKVEKYKMLLCVGIFSGLAFYSYFNFLFFLPGVLGSCLLISQKKQCKNKIGNVIVLLSGYAMGGFLYILGFLEVCLANVSFLSVNNKGTICVGFTIIYYLLLIYLYCLQRTSSKDSRKKSCFIIIFLGIMIGTIGLKTLKLLNNYLVGLNVAGSESDLFGRIHLVLKYLLEVLCHSSEEYIVLRENVCIGISSIVVLTLVLAGVFVYLILKKRILIDTRTRFGGMLSIVAFTYLVVCLPMASRMQGQHFVCMLFVMYLFLGIFLDIICEYFMKYKKGVVILIIMMISYLTLLGLFNQTKINYALQNDKNEINMYYSDAVRIFSESALESAEKGRKEYYVFPEWGYMCGFSYLTGNTIAYVDHFNEQGIQMLYEQGYSIVVCYWDEKNTENYIDNIQNILKQGVMIKEDTIQCWGADGIMLRVEQ